MFGSLVLVFPTEHEGGALYLRHNHQEWVFDSAKLIAEAKSSATATNEKQSHVGYVAFFSDVDHEVAKVISGHRVTITYNLYFKDEEPVVENISMFPPIETNFRTALKSALDDEGFLPDGGFLGFGLSHEYPIETGPEIVYTDKVELIARYLKGGDAVIRRVCKSLGLKTKIMLDFDVGVGSEFLHDTDLRNDRLTLKPYEDEDFIDFIWRRPMREGNSYRINHQDRTPDFEVLWVSDPHVFNQVKLPYLAMGNEPILTIQYGKFCFLVEVGKSGKRKTID